MALNANSMAAAIKTRIAAVSAVQSSVDGDTLAYRDAVMVAMCQGIIDEIHANGVAVVANVQSGSSTVNGTIS